MSTARQERDKALEQVKEHTDPSWASEAEKCIHVLARRYMEFTSDDVWDMLETLGIDPPHERRALGPVMLRMVKSDVITPIGYDTSRRRHGGTVRVYRPYVRRTYGTQQ